MPETLEHKLWGCSRTRGVAATGDSELLEHWDSLPRSLTLLLTPPRLVVSFQGADWWGRQLEARPGPLGTEWRLPPPGLVPWLCRELGCSA
eukprot:705535-Alexandrium_andersonii.AAC.1